MIRVRDSGRGIPPEVVQKMMDPFYTTKEIGKGTGLGLSTSLAIARAHGGHIRVSSEPGRGSRFHVLLPVAQASGPASSIGLGESAPRGQGETVLVVDDEVSVRRQPGRPVVARN